MTDATEIAVADALAGARLDARPIAPVRDRLSDLASAYRVQRILNGERAARGARSVGRKIGLTAEAVQRQLGVDQPDFGELFDDMRFDSGADVPIGALIAPRVEAEIAFVLARDIIDPPADLSSLGRYVEHAVGALEIVDSRIDGWDISIVDTIADNASSALFVLGDRYLTLAEFSPVDVNMTMSSNGTTVSTGNGAACLGDPLNALLWLARTAAEYGDPLRAGQIVLSGALGPVVPIAAGDRLDADLGPFGHVTANFVNGRGN